MNSSPKNTKIILFSTMVIIFLILAYIFKEISLLFFGSYVIAASISPFVDFLSRKMPRGVAITIVYVLGTAIGLLIAIPLLAIISKETTQFINNIPHYFTILQNIIDQLENTFPFLSIDINIILGSFQDIAPKLINKSLDFTQKIFEIITIALSVAVIVLYMLLDKPIIKIGLLSLFPNNIREKAYTMGKSISKKIGGYVIGQVLTMVATGIITALGLLIFKIKYAFLLGLIAGLLDIIPIAGPIIAFTLGVLVALPNGIGAILAVCFVYAFAQWATNQFVRPVLFGKLLDLHPIIIILALLVSAQILGVMGAILSPAIAAAIYVIFQEFYLKVINKNE